MTSHKFKNKFTIFCGIIHNMNYVAFWYTAVV